LDRSRLREEEGWWYRIFWREMSHWTPGRLGFVHHREWEWTPMLMLMPCDAA
jgi:hypothetical protein